MAIIPQQNLFSWENVDAESDLSRLRMVLEVIPDEKLMQKLESERGHGRDDYPVRAVWNSILAGIIYGHPSTDSLRRELLRNGELRQMCGFDPLKGAAAVPSPSAYTRFLRNLFKHESDIEEMFDSLLDELTKLLPDFGEHLAIDSKALESFGNPAKNEDSDGRRDTDADHGKKSYKGIRKDGSFWEKVIKWFGYKLHLIVDSRYELPVAYKVTKASRCDTKELIPMVEKTKKRHPKLIERADEIKADKGYDSEENNRQLYDKYHIKPIIDIRNMWKQGEGEENEEELTRSLFPDRVDNIVYNYKGNVYCVCPKTGEKREMAFYGFEKKRKCLKYRCPAAVFGFKCAGFGECGHIRSDYGRVVRIPLETDRRIFTPLARSSYSWDRVYKKRTAVERVNSRLDVSFGFGLHTIRGLKKMKFRVGIALVIMLAMAVGSIKAGKKERMRSLLKAA